MLAQEQVQVRKGEEQGSNQRSQRKYEQDDHDWRNKKVGSVLRYIPEIGNALQYFHGEGLLSILCGTLAKRTIICEKTSKKAALSF